MAIGDAVEHIDGFDGHDTTSLAYEYTIGGVSTVAVQSSVARNGGKAVECDAGNGAAYFQKLGLASVAARYWGFAFYTAQLGTTDEFLTVNQAGVATHVTLRLRSDGKLEFTRGTTTVIATGTTVLSVDRWYWLDVWVSVADSGGRAAVKIDGASEIDFTGDTRNGGSAVQDSWVLGGITDSNRIMYFDDLIVLNGDHADADFVGDHRVDSDFPESDGDSSQGVPSTGTDHYALVDEDSPSLTDYVDLQAVNDDELYGVPNLPSSPGTILCVAAVMTAAKTDAGTCSAENQLKASGGTIAGGTDHALSTTADHYYDNFPDVPGGTGWTESDYNGIQVGVNRTA